MRELALVTQSFVSGVASPFPVSHGLGSLNTGKEIYRFQNVHRMS